MIQKLDELLELAQQSTPKRVVIAAAQDLHVLEAVKLAVSKNIIIPVFIGIREQILGISKSISFDLRNFEIIEEHNEDVAARKAVSLIKDKTADIIMKGKVSTKNFLKAIVDPLQGIKDKEVMSHIALMQIPAYHKLLALTDVAMNIAPTMEEKVAIIDNSIGFLNNIGNLCVKAAILTPVEILNPKIESAIHAESIMQLYHQGRFQNCILDGPFALDNAISKTSAHNKGIKSQVAGDADLLICHNIDTGNALYKSLIYFAGAESAAIVTGASAPVVLTSRSDSSLTKLYSIALASILK